MDLNEFKKVVMERKRRDGSRYKMSYTTQEREFAVDFIVSGNRMALFF